MSKLSVLLSGALLVSSVATAQNPADFTARDKAEVYIQHMVKIMKLEPSRYQAMVLEYEIGQALSEHSEEFGHDIHHSDFIQSSLRELYPEYARAETLFSEKQDARAEKLVKPLLGNLNPYLAAYAGLLQAEIDLRAGKHEAVVKRCENLGRDHRHHLIADHRACELIALSFRELQKPLLEFAQLAILTTDYDDLPKDVERRVKARMSKLDSDVGNPLKKVAGWMNRVEKLLVTEVTGQDPTQSQEREIVTALDKLIELQEAVERKTCKSCGGGDCKGSCKNGPPKGNKSKSPAKFSALPPRGKGITDLGVSRASNESIWGLLREKDGARSLDAFRGKLPPRYEKLLKQYYEALSKED